MNTSIFVTQPYLPPLEEFTPYLEQIWTNKILTNGGPFHQQLEQALCDYLGVKHVALFSNGTLALITALQALRVTGEVITTPYSFVATTHSLHWHGNKPVFVDVEPETLNLDPAKIEAAITPQTTAIICPDAKTKERIDHLKNFGFVDETTVVAPGINGKMSEVNAAFGMLQLHHMETIMRRRAEVDAIYREGLKGVKGVRCLPQTASRTRNHSYFPILVEEDYPLSRDALYQKLKDHSINARRYFYPLISDFPMYRGLPSSAPSNLPVASQAAQKVLCLPIYPSLNVADQNRVIELMAEH